MKVFVSWSGEISQKYAEALKEWIEQCIQSVEVFFSSEDIEKGDNWQSRLSNELSDTNYGVVCLTNENIDAPWIHFEAGALSKMLDSKVMVLAIGINFADIKGPLKAFQATKLERDDMFRFLKSINATQERPLTDDKLRNSFDAFWPQFKAKIEKIKKESSTNTDDKKSTSKSNINSAVDEILQLVRSQNSLINDPEKILPAEYLAFVLRKNELIRNIDDRILEEIYSFTKYVSTDMVYRMGADFDAFFEQYKIMIDRITIDNPVWKRRFSVLLHRVKKDK